MRSLLGLLLLVLVNACAVTPPPVTPTPDASDAAASIEGAAPASVYTACCASMGDSTPECPATLQHVIEKRLTSVPKACSACNLGCQ